MCTCTCCEDALERLKFGMALQDACYCDLYDEPERCDCGFCLWAIKHR